MDVFSVTIASDHVRVAALQLSTKHDIIISTVQVSLTYPNDTICSTIRSVDSSTHPSLLLRTRLTFPISPLFGVWLQARDSTCWNSIESLYSCVFQVGHLYVQGFC